MTARTYAPGSMAVLALLSACAVGPDYRAPSPASLNVPTNYAADGANAQRADLSAWWSSFDDPILSQLHERALSENLAIAKGVASDRKSGGGGKSGSDSVDSVGGPRIQQK